MKFREIFRFELAYQARRVRTWLYFAVLLVAASLLMRNFIADARNGGGFANSPSTIAFVTVICSVLWVLIATAVAGSSGARDAQTRMHPLIYTTPISKADYLGGRFLAAFVLNALILLMVPVGIMLALFVSRAEPGVFGPSRPAAFVSAYLFLALPTAWAATAIQFSLAALTRRSVTSYLGGVLLCLMSVAAGASANLLGLWTLGKLLDPIHFISNGLISRAWTPIEKDTRLIGLEGLVLANDFLWVGIALGVLTFTRLRFRFAEPAGSGRSARHDGVMRSSRRWWPVTVASAGDIPAFVPRIEARTFGFATRMRQTFAIAFTSFWTIAKGGAGLILFVPIAILAGLWMPQIVNLGGVPVLPRTAQILTHLTSPVAGTRQFPWVLIPLLIVFYAGELAWRERDAGLGEIADTMPVPEWIVFLGKFLALTLLLVVGMALLMTAGVIGQIRMGYFDFEIGLYLRILFGLQLVDYILFALLAFVVHSVVNQKQTGYLVALVAYGIISSPSTLGIGHRLLIYGSDPGWSFSDIRGFGSSLGPWLWFKLYWTGWALLLAVAARLLWVRGTEQGFLMRLRVARRRLAGATARVAAAAAAVVLLVGGFIFYNTNVLNAYVTTAGRMDRSAEYERRYGRYEGIPQPRLTATQLRVEIYPEERKADIRGTYRLVNDNAVAIETVHMATAPQVETTAVSFDRQVRSVLDDETLGHRIYTLERPLQPGDSLQINFEVHYRPRGFRLNGVDTAVVANGTCFTNEDWLPAIGYQPNRQLTEASVRKRYGLPPRSRFSSIDDAKARRIRVGGDLIGFEAIVGTSHDQIAVAPGVLRRTWTAGQRRYFHYVAAVPINNEYGVYSAAYALHEEQWNPSGPAVAIQIFHDPRHVENLTRLVRAVRASLSYHTERLGPYPYSYIRLIEDPTRMGVQTEAATVEYGEAFSLLNPGDGPQDVDIAFAVTAHAVARGWWGMQVAPADVEGSGLLNTGLETYSAMQVVEETLGPEHLARYLRFLRGETPRPRAARPLLRATGSLDFSRRAPFALYAMREYIGKERVDAALRQLFEKNRSGTPPLPTSMDLYRELQAVTPDSFQYLLRDLFEKNTFWEVEAKQATAKPTAGAAWQVTLNLRARKFVADEEGVTTELPMDDWMEVGVVDDGQPQLEKQRIRSGEQTMTFTVPHRPARAGIDPRHLLDELGEAEDNIVDVKIGN